MPDRLFRLGMKTTSFDIVKSDNVQFVMPSSRPLVHMVLDTKKEVSEFDWISLAAWTIKQYFEEANDYIFNQVQITGHVGCIFQELKTSVQCNIHNFNTIYPCPKCTKFISVYPTKLENLSFGYIAILDKLQKFVEFPAIVYYSSVLSLPGKIGYYVRKKLEATKFPLKSLQLSRINFSNKMEILAFAYASLFESLVGNFTVIESALDTPGSEYFSSLLKRTIFFTSAKTSGAINVINTFEGLHFVSCGSRGLEPFPFKKFVSVFEWKVWLLILISIIVLTFAIVNFHKIDKRPLEKISVCIGTFKLLVEQGNPYPASFGQVQKLRLVLSGSFLAAINSQQCIQK